MIAFPLTVLLALPGPVADDATGADGAKRTSLAAAVDQFNEEAAESPIGKTQPPLTTDEVVAAIRSWMPKYGPAVSDERYRQYLQIAETGVLPPGARLHSNTTHYIGGYAITVWWADLGIYDPDGGGYNFRIRDQKLSSRKLTEKELADLERRGDRSRPRAPDRDAAPVD
ncbi:hypothetical protein [Alienimonas californiensis]|uniref:Uncharacterized protein n=1 Tax=Alienimonas californiensis TaxID=2527989 RepID=A0A517PCL4_9PLAN|nr:hypothetical protein [Alienimonas californiensis]QDT17096.1 hypothetical protein CA12_32080 [Alienimonas californiensis]